MAASVPHHPPRVFAEYCARAYFSGASCRRCADACPTAAIEFHPSPVIGDPCVGCGACVGACPTGALDGAPASDEEILASLDPGWLEAGVAVFACERAQAPAGCARVSCMARLTEGLILGAAERGARRVVIREGDCERCELGATAKVWSGAVKLARSVLAAAGAGVVVEVSREEPIRMPPRGSRPRLPSSPRDPGRRSFLRIFVPGGRHAGAIPVGSAGKKQEPPPARRAPPRRARLLSLIDSLGGGPVCLPEGAPVGILEVGDRCFGCKVCEAVCPTGAIRSSVSHEEFLLVVRDSQCVACGSCRDACLDGAIRLRPAATLRPGERTALALAGRPCSRCGGFAAGGTLCRFCRRAGRLRLGAF
jgi:ferredoxin